MRLEMTSLMDVMFLVLVFFIYCIFDMTVHRGVKVDLPTAQGVIERGERLVITITAQNEFQLNGQSLTRDEILSRVTQLKTAGMDLPVIVSGDRAAALGEGIELLAQLKAAGVQQISFQVKGQARTP